jgi:hypothetical protein
MKAVFRWGNLAAKESLVTGMHYQNNKEIQSNNQMVDGSIDSGELSSSQESLDSSTERHGLVTDWLEVWDYVGGARFRGFIAENEGERNLFIFFDQGVFVSDLKPG